jgi:NAD(P)-dependent dehydrogenase (short-subunit alcohol dehydrogenase family)
MSFSGKHALIVGGSSGMGLQAGSLLLKAGASVTIVGSRKEKLDHALKTLGAADKLQAFQCDLRRDADVERLVRHVAEKMKGVKYLVNAAGVFSPKSFLEHTGEDYDAYMRLNRATFFVTQQVAKNMIESKGGAIVNVGSTGNQGDALLGVFHGQGRAACFHPAPCNGTGGSQHPRQCRGPSCGGNTYLPSLHCPGQGA